jgi:enamine deaminase RidA (YjgF/YER057c/UK114 family)
VRNLLMGAALPLLLSFGLLSEMGWAQAGVLKVIRPEGSNNSTTASSPGILANHTLYVSGEDGRNPDGSVPKDFQQEVRQALHSVQGVLQSAGMELKDLASINIYLKNSDNIETLNDVYWKTIGNDPPARTVLVVADLPNKENIEIGAIAVNGSRRQVIYPEGWPRGPHIDPPGVQMDDVLYLSAQGGDDPLTGKQAADFGAEVKQALDNVATVLKTAGMSMANVVWVNPYMSSTGAQERVMNRTYATYFELGNAPGRGTFTVMELPIQSHIMFSCIAGADLSKRKVIRPKNERPSPTASPGVQYGDTLYLSAKDAYVPALGIISPDLDIQTKLSMRNLLDGLQEADMDFTNVVSATVYLRDIKDIDQLNSIYGKFFKGALPAQTVLQQNQETKDIDTEQISVVAVGSQKP